MDHFNYRSKQLYAEDVSVADIAKLYGTPCYVYSRATLERHWHVFDQAFGKHPHKICYAVKANSNIGLLNILAQLGSGFDIVSQGELERVLAAGGKAEDILFSGVGKLESEMIRALEVGIGCFNVESAEELYRLQAVAQKIQKTAPISLRVNPNIDAQTHPYIATGLKENKFGIDIQEAMALYQEAIHMPYLKIVGIDYHIGSQLTQTQPFIDAFEKVYALIKQLRQQGIAVSHLDIGGGLGVRYCQEEPPSPNDYIQTIIQKLGHDALPIIVEPGRAIVANAGILVTRVEYLKNTAYKNFAIVDAAMNDLLRPALYNAYQEIVAVNLREGRDRVYDVVGPVCETGDFLGKERSLVIEPNDLLAIRTAGAYGFTMSSNYNSRPRAAEVMVDKDQCHLIRSRETIADLFCQERLIPAK